ncbi:hypothetical protein FACS189450_04030 [Spirochaetia bacterium]|nr:hypothetical protein FACS189450_04030 [Spirochaetia bacterium]
MESLKKEKTLLVNGRNILFQEYGTSPEVVKVCTYDHDVGVAGEYQWVRTTYPAAHVEEQQFTELELSGKKVKCDILTIQTSDGQTKDIYFDISQMMEDFRTGIINKGHWDARARMIYEKLVSEYHYAVDKDDEECLFKEIKPGIRIAFDKTFYFGLVFTRSIPQEPSQRRQYEKALQKYISNGFICNIQRGDVLLGGYMPIDLIKNIAVVFQNFETLEDEIRRIGAMV